MENKIIITPQHIVKIFKTYHSTHPLKIICDIFYDENGAFKTEDLAEYAWAFNTINAVGRALMTLSQVSMEAYEDMVEVKLRAKKKKGYNRHNLISAFCELSLMNTFIVRSSDRNSFVYEDRCVEGSDKNVEFSIKMAEFTFHVEVKTSDLLMEDRNIVKALENSEQVLVLDARNKMFKEIKEKSKNPVIGSLDNRLIDYLESANGKFSPTKDEMEINLLVICWDDRIHQPLMALKSEDAEGLLTVNTHLKEEDGSLKTFDNVDCILLNSSYHLFKEYIGFMLFDEFSPQYPVDPFYQLFTYNYLIDRNLTEDRVKMIQSIIQQRVIIVDEEYAKSLPPVSVAFMKDKESNVISFRKRNIEDVVDLNGEDDLKVINLLV